MYGAPSGIEKATGCVIGRFNSSRYSLRWDVWILLRRPYDWRWGIEGEQTSWYGSATLLRECGIEELVARVKKRMAEGGRRTRVSLAAPLDLTHDAAVMLDFDLGTLLNYWPDPADGELAQRAFRISRGQVEEIPHLGEYPSRGGGSTDGATTKSASPLALRR